MGNTAHHRAAQIASCKISQSIKVGFYSCDDNDGWFEDEFCHREETESKVDEDEVLAQLCEDLKEVFRT